MKWALTGTVACLIAAVTSLTAIVAFAIGNSECSYVMSILTVLWLILAELQGRGGNATGGGG